MSNPIIINMPIRTIPIQVPTKCVSDFVGKFRLLFPSDNKTSKFSMVQSEEKKEYAKIELTIWEKDMQKFWAFLVSFCEDHNLPEWLHRLEFKPEDDPINQMKQ